MKEVRKIANGAKNSESAAVKRLNGLKMRMAEPVSGENTRRATEIGPVLEEILHSDHWVLN